MNIKILAVGDLHLRKNKPSLRKDDFERVMWNKLRQIKEIANESKCDLIVFPGDVFDSHAVPYATVEKAIRRMCLFDGVVLFVYGQHDQRYHSSDKLNTPLGVLSTAINCRVLGNTWISAGTLSSEKAIQAHVCGASWGEDLPTEKADKDGIHIAVCHKTISPKPLPWDGCYTADELLAMCPADVFICGDNHAYFIHEKRGRVVLNMGSVMRTNVDQKDHIPTVAVITIDEDKSISIDPIELMHRNDVFDLEKVEVKKEQDDKIAEFVSSFNKEFDPEMTFIDNLRQASSDAPEGVQKVIQQVME